MQIAHFQNPEQVPWPDTPDGDYARRVLSQLMCVGPRAFIRNVTAEVQALVVGDQVLPLVVAAASSPIPNAYVCSPTTHYIDYAIREIELELPPGSLLRRVAPPLLAAFRPLFAWAQIEQAVYVNNWLLSTNLYPPLQQTALQAITAYLMHCFPQHAIIFRSLNMALQPELITALADLGYQAVFSRQVYLLDTTERSYRQKRDYKNDRRLARETTYRWVDAHELHQRDCVRLQDLYDDLYIRKYSHHNPQFTVRFLNAALTQQWLTLYALQCRGRIDGVLGFVERQGALTAPLIGYDRALPQSLGLYRLLSLKISDEAEQRGRLLHLSSGAAAFKRSRGGQPALEYSLIYQQHLSPHRRLPWHLLALLSRRMIIPVMERYGL